MLALETIEGILQQYVVFRFVGVNEGKLRFVLLVSENGDDELQHRRDARATAQERHLLHRRQVFFVDAKQSLTEILDVTDWTFDVYLVTLVEMVKVLRQRPALGVRFVDVGIVNLNHQFHSPEGAVERGRRVRAHHLLAIPLAA